MSNLSYLWIAFGRINEIEWGITPQEWLENHWYVRWNDSILAEPSSTFFVFFARLCDFVVVISTFKNH